MRFLSGFLGSAEFLDPFVYLVVVSFLLATTLLASYLPASRIGRIDPVEVLREE
jgi:ABC-type lipoprotein release transport system permease subunit